MQTFLKLISVLPGRTGPRWRFFFAGWIGYARFAKRRAMTQPSVLASTNRVRHHWMLQTTRREVRVVDAVVMQSLSTSPSFFASTTILIIGGLLAALGTSEKASELVRDLPFTTQTSTLVFDLKLVLLRRLRLRLLPFHLVDAAIHLRRDAGRRSAGAEQTPSAAETQRNAFADRAGRIVSLAAETFNDGLRGYYFAFAAIGWFFSPIAFHGRHGGRDRHPVPARIPVGGAAGAGGPSRPSSSVARQAQAAELPARVGREEVAVAGADVAGGVAQEPPRSTIWLHMNLPLYSPTAPAAGRKPG